MTRHIQSLSSNIDNQSPPPTEATRPPVERPAQPRMNHLLLLLPAPMRKDDGANFWSRESEATHDDGDGSAASSTRLPHEGHLPRTCKRVG